MTSSRTPSLLFAVAIMLAGCAKDTETTTYTITIDPVPTGGSIALDPDQEEYAYLDTVQLTATPEEGYVFDGWVGEVVSPTENPTMLIVEDDMVVSATFTQIPTYTITIDPAPTGGSITLDPPTGPYDEGSEVTVTATAETGYSFTGWSGDITGDTSPETLTMDSDKTISATFTANPTYTITIDPAPTGGTITLDPPTGPYDEGTEVTVTATANIGYTFTGWSGDLTGDVNPETLTMDSDRTISATFEYDGDVWVRTTGLDENPGTPEEPVQSIARAYEILAAGTASGTIHIAAGTYEVDFSAGTHVVAVEGVNMYGGYAADDWSDRDVSSVYEDTLHQSIIVDVTSSGSPSLAETAKAIHIGSDITSATVFDGLYVRGGAAGTNHTCGIHIDQGNPTITNSYVNGGGGSYTIGVYVWNSSDLRFSKNHVIGGDMVDLESTGIYADSANLTLTDNIIDGGCGGGNVSTALDLRYTTATVADNTIIGGTGGNARGFYIDGESYVDILGNTVHVSNDTEAYGEFYGVVTWSGDTNIINNVFNINGQLDPHTVYGVVLNASNTTIINNTFQLTSHVNGDANGVTAWGSYNGTVIENNIFTTESPSGYGHALYVENASSIANNNMSGFDFYAWLGQGIEDLDTTVIDTDAGTGTLASFGNVDIDMIDNGGADHYVDPDGADDDLSTTDDNDFHLTADAAILEVRQGGLDQTALTSYPTDGTDPIDRDGTARTASSTSATNPGAAGWSMGAYEQD